MRNLRTILTISAVVAGASLAGCGGGSSSKSNSSNPPSSPTTSTAGNVAPITVNSGPNGNYVDGAFASVTLCVPSTSTCQTIGGVLVDTGSSGLRMLSSAITIALPQQKTSGGDPVAECLPFLASYTWGPVETADVQLAGEKAKAVPIQVLSDTDFKVPSGCTNFGLRSADTLQSLGANGILGVGMFAQDCGSVCAQTGSQNPALYYQCPPSGCQPIAESLSQQVTNPVVLFPSDNNGVIVELPQISGGQAPTVSGSLVFGIDTQSNNGLGATAVYTAPGFAFTTTFNGKSYPGSFIDSGSNGFFFPNTSGITECGTNDQGFYCPAMTEKFSAINRGANGASGTVNFSIANAATLFATGDAAFNDLGGPTAALGSPATVSTDFFDWGLPFFFGRNVYTAIEGMSTPAGAGPYWAY